MGAIRSLAIARPLRGHLTIWVSRSAPRATQPPLPAGRRREWSAILCWCSYTEGLSPETQQRIDELVAKRQAATITPEERAALIALTDQSEQRAARRVAALAALAQLRRMPLPDLMDSLGLSPPPYA